MSVCKSAEERWPGPLLYLSLIALTAVLDLACKYAIVELLEHGTRAISLLPFLDLRLSYNRGISFSLFEAEHTGHVTLLILLTGFATVAFAVAGLFAQSPTERIALSLVSGGAAGNVLDRAANHGVTDFISFHIHGWRWPSFNVADTAIALGVAMLLAAALLPLGKAWRS
jgi:signal peptidase II